MTEAFDSHAAADALHEWFRSVVRIADKSWFSMAPEGPHRNAIVLDVLTRNARTLASKEVDREGTLYSPLSYFLAAASRQLRAPLGLGHWEAAVENVNLLRLQMTSAREESSRMGLELGSPAQLFKQELDEAIRHAGLSGKPSFLGKQDREIALGLAVNWGLRFLLAYALECDRHPDPGRKDLTWIAGRLDPVFAA